MSCQVHCKGLSRDLTYGEQCRECSSPQHFIQVQNVTDFSTFVRSGQGEPRTVVVGSFSAGVGSRAVALTWETITEVYLLVLAGGYRSPGWPSRYGPESATVQGYCIYRPQLFR
jgi:hypothetical protein